MVFLRFLGRGVGVRSSAACPREGRGVGVRPGVATPLPRVTGVIAEGGVADSGRAAPLPCKKRLWLRAAGDFFAK